MSAYYAVRRLLSKSIVRHYHRVAPARIPYCPKAASPILYQTERSIKTYPSWMIVSEEVRDAIGARKPVIALETTIYTHGFPYPENFQLATRLETAARAHGATPATIGVIDGIVRVGMTRKELEYLTLSARENPSNTMKVARRDLPYICGKVGQMRSPSLHS